MFYQTGIDITNDKQMFNFLKSHFKYSIRGSIEHPAHNVKLYLLDLPGDWNVAYCLLALDAYIEVNSIIDRWIYDHPDYDVFFCGRSNGYLVLTDAYGNSVIPDEVIQHETYEEYKDFCRETYGSVKVCRDTLRESTKVVREFDLLCDHLRDICAELSLTDPEIVVNALKKIMPLNLFRNVSF